MVGSVTGPVKRPETRDDATDPTPRHGIRLTCRGPTACCRAIDFVPKPVIIVRISVLKAYLVREGKHPMAEPPPRRPAGQNNPQPTPALTPSPAPATQGGAPLPTPTVTTGDPLPIPKPTPSTNHTGTVTGVGAGTSTTDRDLVTDLTAEKKYQLLKRNNIEIDKRPAEVEPTFGSGKMAAYRLESDLVPAKDEIRFKSFALREARIARVDRSSLSYNEFEWNLQRQSVTQSKTEFGIPGLFNIAATYRDSASVSTYSRKMTAHFQASQFLPKANVVFRENDISLSDEFSQQIQSALKPKSDRDRAIALLNVLKDYGHFVPLDIILGGRISTRPCGSSPSSVRNSRCMVVSGGGHDDSAIHRPGSSS